MTRSMSYNRQRSIAMAMATEKSTARDHHGRPTSKARSQRGCKSQ
jgi:hypothetical protein